MQTPRFQKLQSQLQNPILIKKKENLLYLTGRSFMHGYLLVKPGGKRMNTNKGKRNNADVVFLGDGLEKIENIHSDILKNVGMYISKKETLEVFGEFTYAEVKYIKFKNPKLKIKITIKHDPVDHIRTIKDKQEIGYIKKSMQIVAKVFALARKEIKKPGMTEFKLAQFIQSLGIKLGAENLAFPAIVACGSNAAVPHHVPSSKKLKAGESIIIDFGFKYKNYCSDFTRTVFLKHAPKKLAEAYEQTEKAYNESIDFVSLRGSAPPVGGRRSNLIIRKKIAASSRQVGTPRNDTKIFAGAVYQKSVEVLAEKKLDKYFIHSLGHGTGLEIHELPNLSPNSKDILQNGMVFSIEPGVYFSKTGGIRIEDLVYLEEGKARKFINVSTKLKDNIL